MLVILHARKREERLMAGFCGACGQPLVEINATATYARFDPGTGAPRKVAVCRNEACPQGCLDTYGEHAYPFSAILWARCRRCGDSSPA